VNHRAVAEFRVPLSSQDEIAENPSELSEFSLR
jgi:hypothetical protein